MATNPDTDLVQICFFAAKTHAKMSLKTRVAQLRLNPSSCLSQHLRKFKKILWLFRIYFSKENVNFILFSCSVSRCLFQLVIFYNRVILSSSIQPSSLSLSLLSSWPHLTPDESVSNLFNCSILRLYIF